MKRQEKPEETLEIGFQAQSASLIFSWLSRMRDPFREQDCGQGALRHGKIFLKNRRTLSGT